MAEHTVLAIALDSADPPLVRDLIDRGELPVLARLEREGSWGAIAPAPGGSTAAWPTFYTGKPVEEHGAHSTWQWNPASMRALPLDVSGLVPFWAAGETSASFGLLDVPLAPRARLAGGFDVADWGAHAPLLGRTEITPDALRDEVTEAHEVASKPALRPTGADMPMDPEELVEAALKGLGQRSRLAARLIARSNPTLALIAFTELHHCGHELWHTAEPDHPVYQGLYTTEPRSVLEVYREADRQLGWLLDAVGEEEPVVVFSLLGMRPTRGVCQALHPALSALGYTAPAHVGNGVVPAALSSLKRGMPLRLKRIYHATLPQRLRRRIAREAIMPPIDWSCTRAFALPSADQNGDIRVNLRGREAQGIVEPADYRSLCEKLTETVSGLLREDGEPLVRRVEQVGDPESPPAVTPDLIVHWTEAALADPLHVRDPAVSATPIAKRVRGQHRPGGFFIARGLGSPPADTLDLHEFRELLLRACAVPAKG